MVRIRIHPVLYLIVAALLLPGTLFYFSPVAAQEGPPSAVRLELVAEGLNSPVDLEQPDDDSGRMFIADRAGLIYTLDADGNLLEEPFLDLRNRIVELMEGFDERGLLGMALHPDFANNGRLYVHYSAPLRDEAPDDWNHTAHISEFTVSADNPDQADPDSERVLLQVDEPQFNHNGGGLMFGPDGYLYIPLGDGGGADDAGLGHNEEIGNAQDLSTMLGKILRIDVDNGDPYSIPDDNPFVDDENALDEIWAYGLRNPWRMSFDDDYGLIVADVGQNVWEEVTLVDAGENHGWRIREGSHCFSVDYPNHNPLECETTGPNGEDLVPPVIEYTHQNGISIAGGYIYRGSAMPSGLQGLYVFGDWSTSFGSPAGQIFVATPPPADAGDAMWKMNPLTIESTGTRYMDTFLLAFAEDNAGEIYVLTSDTAGPTDGAGKVWRIAPATESDAEGEDD